MQITFSPVRADGALALFRSGDTLQINGVAFDFGPMTEGSTLPRAAVACPWIGGDVTLSGGVLTVPLVLPYGVDAPQAVRFPMPVEVPVDGPVVAPGLASPDEATEVGIIDWGALITAEAAETAAREAWRQSASLSRAQFLAALIGAGVVTTPEAIAMGSGGIPAALTGAVDAMPDPPKSMLLMLMATAQQFDRLDPFLAGLGDALGWSDEQRDALFGWGA